MCFMCVCVFYVAFVILYETFWMCHQQSYQVIDDRTITIISKFKLWMFCVFNKKNILFNCLVYDESKMTQQLLICFAPVCMNHQKKNTYREILTIGKYNRFYEVFFSVFSTHFETMVGIFANIWVGIKANVRIESEK